MSHEHIRRALEDARRRTGMEVGLPQVKVDASQLQYLLNERDHLEARAEKAEAELARARERYRWRGPMDYKLDGRLIELVTGDGEREIVKADAEYVWGSDRWRYCDDGPQEDGNDE